MKSILEVSHVGKKYTIKHRVEDYLSLREQLVVWLTGRSQKAEEFWALQDVSFDVKQGESLGIIGRNGAGKSTLLKILSKITTPTRGKIHFRGRIVSLLEVGTGFHPELTGRENVFFNGSLLGMKKRDIERKFDEIVAFSGTEKFLDTPLKHYSSGMQLRLAFSVAAFLEPEILIIDEVLAVGDADFQKKCIGKMEDVGKSGRTILFVSHNLGAVSQLCPRTLLLDSGQVRMIGPTSTVIQEYMNAEKSVVPDAEIRIAPGIFFKDLSFVLTSKDQRNELAFSFSIDQASINVISGLALLIYNAFNERVAIVDLRTEDLFRLSSSSQRFRVTGIIYDLPIIEGNYQVGAYLASNLFQGNRYHIGQFEVPSLARNIMPYPASDRGHVELRASFKHELID